MNKPATGWTDQSVETIIGNLLRAGVLLAAAIVAFGGAIFLARHGPRHLVSIKLPRQVVD